MFGKKLAIITSLSFVTVVLAVGTSNRSENVLNAAETIVYSTGFEVADSFSAGTVYNNTTINYGGPTGQQWGTYYGTASTTGPITGSQSMQMRWYSTAPANIGYTFTNFDIQNVTKVTFKALNTSGNNVNVSYSTDGGSTYTGGQTFTLGTSAASFTYNISAIGEFENVRLKFTMVPGTTTGSRVTLDDITVYQYVSSTINVSSVSLDKESSSLYVGGTEQLTATVLPTDATDKSVSWSSDTPSVATISTSGLVTAVSAGTAIITVTTTDGDFTDTCTYTITAVVLNSISIKTPATKTTFSLGEGFSSAGLVIDAVYNSGTVELSTGYEITGVDTFVLGSQTATVSYEGKTTTYNIDVTNLGASVGASIIMSDLIISEYIEGASYNKAIEIFNGTGTSVDLSNYSLKIASNGSNSWGSSLALSGTLANNDVYVLAHKDAASDILAVTDFSETAASVINFNGDDSIGLFKNTNLIDLFGNITGTDPGTSWAVPYYDSGELTATTHDNTWVRHSSISDPNSTSPFASTEWLVYPVGTHSYLGSHTSGGGNVTSLEQASAFADYVMTGIGLNASGSCQAVYDELELEYGYMDSDSKTEFNTNVDTLFVNARARLSYLDSFLEETFPQSVQSDAATLDSDENNLKWLAVFALVFLAGAVVYQFKIRRRA